jgi:deoxyribose-phosphate aldolase
MNLRVVDHPAGSKPAASAAVAPADKHRRNPGFPLDLDWVERVRMNRSALERRAATLPARRTVKKDFQVAWLLKAITLMDLTTLNSDDTPGRVERLCAKARHPLRTDIVEGFDIASLDIKPAAVCVYHSFVKTAVEALKGTGINANEIDIVIERGMVLRGDWQALYDEVKAMRKACGDAHIKTILGTGELATQTNVAKASLVCMLAGADFIKTSTGKEKVNANLQTSLSMVRMIRWFHEETGIEIGYKPAGGISTAKVALDYMALIKEELGTHWLQPHLFRFGASSLLTDIERQLEHGLTGHYAADYRMPLV